MRLLLDESLPRYAIAVVVLRGKTNRLEDLAPLVPGVLELLPSLQVGNSIVVDSFGS